MLLNNLLDEINYIELVNCDDLMIEITGISYNSKKAKRNDIFICLTGEHVDGHEYAEEATNNGVSVCVVERRLNLDAPQIVVDSTQEALAKISSILYSNPSSKLNVIGVTGTNGKTTVSHLIQKLYEAFDKKCVLIGTLGHKFDSSQRYHDAKHTTPQAPELQELLYNANERFHNNVVMEVSSHAIAQHRVDCVDFRGAIFTNLTQDHLDFHVTMENYFRTKAKLFEDLVIGDFAVINIDDEYGKRLVKSISPSVELVTYGTNEGATVRATDIDLTDSGAKFNCIIDGEKYPCNLIMSGMFSVYNVLAAISTAKALGFDIKKSIEIFESIPGVAGRFEVIVSKPIVIVDYAHTPDGLENVLNAAKRITPDDGQLICIFGCGGDRDTTKRPKMGAIAEKIADKVIITSDNPRSENPQQIITDILAGFENTDDVIVEPDRELAIKESYKIANLNDVILIAGKGHEDYQIIGNETIHFDDREIAKKIFIGE